MRELTRWFLMSGGASCRYHQCDGLGTVRTLQPCALNALPELKL